MKLNTHSWSHNDKAVNLLNLFKYLNYKELENTAKYVVFEKQSKYYVVVKTEKGYVYYKTDRPKEKLKGTDIIKTFVSSIETKSNSSIWSKIDSKYKEYLDSGEDLQQSKNLEIVPTGFNHFLEMNLPVESPEDSLYRDIMNDPQLEDRIYQDTEGKILFPLYNNDKSVCGYLTDHGKSVTAYKHTRLDEGIWFNKIPKKIEQILVFKDPKEAIAFYSNFKLDNTLYVACSNINYTTTKMLFDIKKASKSKEFIVSFTGTKKINGYLQDLNFVSFLREDDFNISIRGDHMYLVFKKPEEKIFAKFYRKVVEFNESISKEYIRFNQITNQPLVQKNSIIPKRLEDGNIVCIVPLEVNAIKFITWAYFKFFLAKEMGILKPKENNWYAQYQKLTSNNEKVDTYEEFRLAM